MNLARTILPIEPSGKGPLEREGQGKHYRGQDAGRVRITFGPEISRLVGDGQDIEKCEGNQGGQKASLNKAFKCLHGLIGTAKRIKFGRLQPAVFGSENDNDEGDCIERDSNDTGMVKHSLSNFLHIPISTTRCTPHATRF